MADALDHAAALASDVEDLLQATGLLLRRLRSESNPGELTWSQFAALARLGKLGPATTADLARAETVKPQSMGATLAALEQAGFIERRPHPSDGRQVLFALTEGGDAAWQEGRRLRRAWLGQALNQLNPAEREAVTGAAAVIRRLATS
ncbi:MarR family transcriptional regulator [Methylobacterium brachythecii]|uniref:MarR family transcriptional regulator n=1 Tax=Methylobacterium brachythecii TaxID=1176177 RepID=A0A7W6F635_9HYPH|nr:MarR family transcriptional regulator [Methylobacterium brachythecii]MBB3901970.1 DNA-binding MarR family transcriptional regulator [Methylobacterium brachythecii]GLS43352.1 MarR family transcriptional regulator [Methylobacterium brachythecii]